MLSALCARIDQHGKPLYLRMTDEGSAPLYGRLSKAEGMSKCSPPRGDKPVDEGRLKQHYVSCGQEVNWFCLVVKDESQ